MRTALMYLVIGRLKNGGAANAALVADEEADCTVGPAQLGIPRESGMGSLNLAGRRRRDASSVRADPPEAAA